MMTGLIGGFVGATLALVCVGAKIKPPANPAVVNANNTDSIIERYNQLPTRQTTHEDILWYWRLSKAVNPALTKGQFSNILKAMAKEAKKDYADIVWANVDP
jgi:hypothetical protein